MYIILIQMSYGIFTEDNTQNSPNSIINEWLSLRIIRCIIFYFKKTYSGNGWLQEREV